MSLEMNKAFTQQPNYTYAQCNEANAVVEYKGKEACMLEDLSGKISFVYPCRVCVCVCVAHMV